MVLGGVTVKVKVAHVRLCFSRVIFFLRAYLRETQEMLFDAHNRAFEWFGVACQRGIYDNMRTAVDVIFAGRERQFNRRFVEMCTHHLVAPEACTPGAGWEKGQVERDVGDSRERLFRERRQFADYADLNDWLFERCGSHARSHPHPEIAGKTIWEVFEEQERDALIPWCGAFDGYRWRSGTVSKVCLVRFDSNRYSVAARAAQRPVEIFAYTDRVDFRFDGELVGSHPRSFGRGETLYDWLHYLPVLERKPGALRNGAPFRTWELPGPIAEVRARLAKLADGDRQMVQILAMVPQDGLQEVAAACAEALATGAVGSDRVLNLLSHRRDPGPAPEVETPAGLRLAREPEADCGRYDALRDPPR